MPKSSMQQDDAQLAALGHKAELNRNFSMLSMLGLAFAVLNSWTALSASLSVSLSSGGSTSIVWGEPPTHTPRQASQPLRIIQTNNLKSSRPGNCGDMQPLYRDIVGGVPICISNGYQVANWQQFLIYIGFTLIAFLLNAFMNSVLPRIYKGALFWSLGGFAIVSITALACASPNYNSGKFVFTEFINQTGWPDGVAWLLGLLQGGLGLTAFDSVAHMIEEIPQPSKKGPKIMVGCIGIGIFTGFVFLVVMLFVAGDIQQVITSGAGPLLQILINATSNTAGAICLLMFPLVCLAFATISVMTTSSRMIFAFARDGGLPASKFLARVHPQLGLPLNALVLTSVVVIIFGLINIASTNAFNAIISAAVVTLDLSYAMPIAVNCLQGRNTLPDRDWKLPTWLGWTCDVIALSYIAITTVLFVFPPERHVTGSNMNYCIVAFAIILAISVFQWIVDGRKNYAGPRIDVAVAGMPIVSKEEEETAHAVENKP
ncbi:amino acid/polyamine transporter I [Cordyceps fumosorosea ARSEF 2679]|uniref:Amino acid/polyamine transporter I n=1 Tax=Cordyceps fumosorosea (strain ARSEF 2679) TaxID=1081104 RepID=A0A167I8V1_CORFA|nr:amino acid/polyamine transporter I [Cordyceps fumosorosea ARSEF 2679]OAA48802.1 amino acid/polyamine transporter I [Cordyceps fumosorosea ARSEF 2679]